MSLINEEEFFFFNEKQKYKKSNKEQGRSATLEEIKTSPRGGGR